MVNFAMIHSSRVDRVRSRHLGRIQTQKQWKCHQPISTLLDASTKKGDEQSVLYLLTVSDVSTKRGCRRESNWAAVIPPTMVKIMTLECHTSFEVNAFLYQLRAYNSPQHQMFLQGRAFLLVWQGECFTQPRDAAGVEQHEHLRFDISAFRSSNATACPCDALSTTFCRPVRARAKESFAHNSATHISGTGIRTNDCIQHRSWHPAF